jgi:hypothetical protein
MNLSTTPTTFKPMIASVASSDPLGLKKHKIFDFVKLEYNWDGENGIPLYSEVAEKAIVFLKKIGHNPTDYFPNGNGTLTIEWEKDKKHKLSVEIGKSKFSMFAIYGGDKMLMDGADVNNYVFVFDEIIKMIFR